MNDWTAAEDMTLAFGTLAGLSRSQIGALIKRSRNGVCGRAFRLGLSQEKVEVAPTLPAPLPPSRPRRLACLDRPLP
jgi:hypothetical protein